MINASISAGQSIEASMKVRDTGRQQKPASQTDPVAEKIVSGKDGTVTEAPINT